MRKTVGMMAMRRTGIWTGALHICRVDRTLLIRKIEDWIGNPWGRRARSAQVAVREEKGVASMQNDYMNRDPRLDSVMSRTPQARAKSPGRRDLL